MKKEERERFTLQTTFRLSEDMSSRLDEELRRRRQESPGSHVTLGDVIRTKLALGLEFDDDDRH